MADVDDDKRLRRDLKEEVRREMTAEVEGKIRMRVEADIRKKARVDVLREIAESAPSEAQRDRFRAYVRDVELDAYAQATIASRIADDAEADLAKEAQRTRPLRWGLVISAPVVFYAMSRFAPVNAAMVVIAVLAIAAAAFSVGGAQRRTRLQERTKVHRAIGSDFLIIAERAKAYTYVHADRIASAQELQALVEDLRVAKEKQDRQFHASTSDLEAARQGVRHRIAEGHSRVADFEDDEAERLEAIMAERRRRL